jgi:hypothetical protein
VCTHFLSRDLKVLFPFSVGGNTSAMMEPLNTINDVQTFLFRATQIATNHGCLIGDVQLDGSVAHGAAMDYDESSHSSSEDCHKGLKIRLLNHLSATMCQTRGDNSPCVALLKETLTGGVVTVWVTSATAVPPHLKDQVCAFLSSIGSYMEIIGQGRRGMYRSTEITYLC